MREIQQVLLFFFSLSIVLASNNNDKPYLTSLAVNYKTHSLNLTNAWNNISKLISFDEIIESYPYLVKNLKPTILAELIDKGQCKIPFQPVRYAIVDNTVYSYGETKHNQLAILFENLLKRITVQTKLSDCYFVVHVNGRLIFQDKQESVHHGCRSLPSFVYQKNQTSEVEKTKFLLPDPTLIDEWAQSICKIKEIQRRNIWQNKINQVFYQMSNSSQQSAFLKQCKNRGSIKNIHRVSIAGEKMKQQNYNDSQFQQSKKDNSLLKPKELKDNLIERLKYKFILQENYSGKNTTLSFFTNSILLRPFSVMAQWFFSYINPNTHFMLVQKDCSNLHHIIQQLIGNKTKTLQILKQANAISQKYLSQSGITNFVIQSLRKYSNIQNLTLTKNEKNKVKSGIDINQVLLQKKEKQQSQVNQLQLERWKKSMKLVSFQETIQSFSFIQKNINYQKIFDLLEAGGCGPDKRFVNYVIINNHVYVSGWFKDHVTSRNLTKLFRTLTKKYILPDMFFLVHIQDQLHPEDIPKPLHKICREIPLFMVNKNTSAFMQQTKFLLPDPYVIDNWRENIQKTKQISKKITWQQKINKAFFRGLASGPNYYDIKPINSKTNIYKYFHRGGFALLANERPDLIEAKFTPQRFNLIANFLDEMGRRIGKENIVGQSISLDYQLKFRYLLSADGFGTSWRRIPIILFSNSILFKPYSEKVQWFYDKMIPDYHFVPLNQDISDLIKKIQDFNKNDTKINQIIHHANIFADKQLTPEAIQSYTYQTLMKYAAIQKLKLTQFEKQFAMKGFQMKEVMGREKNIRSANIMGISFIVITAILLLVLLRFASKQTQQLKRGCGLGLFQQTIIDNTHQALQAETQAIN